MKNKSHIQQHPNQEDKSGKATYASSTRNNSSTTRKQRDASDMPEGAETDMKSELLRPKKNAKRASTKK
jgi:hypothetical protein